MNIYEDYESYKLENEELLNELVLMNDQLNILLDDVVKLLDYLTKKVADGAHLSKEEDEIFDIGYGFFSNTLEELKIYYKEYFNSDIILYNHYSSLIFYSIYLDDLKSFYETEEIHDDDINKLINDTTKNIEDILMNKKKINDNYYDELELVLEEATPTDYDFKPAYIIFNLMCEELGIE